MLNTPSANPQLTQMEASALRSALNKPPLGAPQPQGGPKHDIPDPILLDYRRIRVAIERTLENESDPQFESILHSWHLAIRERERGTSGAEIMQILQQPMAPGPAPAAPGPPQAAVPGPPQVGMGPQA